MDINNSSLSRFKNKPGIARTSLERQSISEVSKPREASPSAATQSGRPPALQEGQIIKGQIIDRRYNEVSIQLEPEKQIVKARLTGDFPLSIGQQAQFQVTEDTNDHLVLKYLPSETATPTDATIQKALSASNFPLTERNKVIVSELLNHRMPIDKQTLQLLIKLSHTNREASPLTLVIMHKNNIPMTAENIRQFEAYQNGSQQLLENIRDISNHITELLKQTVPSSQVDFPPARSGNLSEVIHINNQLIDILNRNQSMTTEASALPLDNLISQEELTLLGKAIMQKLAEGASLPPGSSPDIQQKIINGTATLDEANQLISDLYHELSDQGSGQLLAVTAHKDQYQLSLSSVLQKLMNLTGQSPKNMTVLEDVLNQVQRDSLLGYIHSLPDTYNLKEQIQNGSSTLYKVLSWIKETLPQADGDAAGRLLQSPEYRTLLEESFHQKWMITPEKLAQKTPVTKLYQNLLEDLEKLEQISKLSAVTSETLQINEPVKNLQENLHFLKDLNDIFTFLPLPVQLKDRELHSDLYVFSRKKSQHEKQDNPSVLLHLDMINLGSLNIHIQMKHNQIQAKFYLEKPDVLPLLTEHIPQLEEALKMKGYHLQAELDTSYKKPDFSRDFIEQNSQESNIHRFTFDIRT